MKFNHNKTPHITIKDKIILYDGICKLCNAWCQFVIRHDKNSIFKLASMQSDKGQDILKNLEQPTTKFETMLYIENNTLYKKSSAFLQIVRHLPFPIKSFLILKLIPNVIRDYIYDQIALNRYKIFGQYKECRIPLEDNNRHL